MISTRKEAGDTLIEVTIAIAILTAVLIATLGIANVALANGRAANNRGDAVALLQQQAEIARNMRDSDLIGDAANGWADFKLDLFGIGGGSVCNAGNAGNLLRLRLPGANLTSNQWVWRAATSTYNITTSTNTYTISVRACYADASQEKVNFSIHADWPGVGANTDSSDLSTSLEDIGNIQEQPPGYSYNWLPNSVPAKQGSELS